MFINLAKLESDGTSNWCANANVYCFAEHDDIGIFAEQVVAMRQWMKTHGQQQKPLIITEYSQLYPYIPEGGGCFLMDEYGNCFTELRVTQFLQETVDFLENSKDSNLVFLQVLHFSLLHLKLENPNPRVGILAISALLVNGVP